MSARFERRPPVCAGKSRALICENAKPINWFCAVKQEKTAQAIHSGSSSSSCPSRRQRRARSTTRSEERVRGQRRPPGDERAKWITAASVTATHGSSSCATSRARPSLGDSSCPRSDRRPWRHFRAWHLSTGHPSTTTCERHVSPVGRLPNVCGSFLHQSDLDLQ